MSTIGTTIGLNLALSPDERTRKSSVQQLRNRLKLSKKKEGGRIAGIEKQYGSETVKLLKRILKDQDVVLERDTWILPIMIWLGRAVSLNQGLRPSDWPPLESVARWSTATGSPLIKESLESVASAALMWSTTTVREMTEAFSVAGLEPDDPETRKTYERAILWIKARTTLGDTAPWPSPVLIQRLADGSDMGPESFEDISQASIFKETSVDKNRNMSTWDEWHKRIVKLEDDSWRPSHGPIVHSWENGMKLVELETENQLRDESKMMDHCIGQDAHINDHLRNMKARSHAYYSLRDVSGYSVCTFEIALGPDRSWMRCCQSKGPKNFGMHPTWVNYAVQVIGRCERFSYPENYSFESAIQGIDKSSEFFVQTVLTSPELSYRWAMVNGGGETLRETASRDPAFAILYATNVDKAPHTVTRDGACTDPLCAVRYAVEVDKGPTEQTRNAACSSPSTAYRYATSVDKGPTPQTLAASFTDNTTFLNYTRSFPNTDLSIYRDIAIKSGASGAYTWALNVDRGPREDTRKACCTDPVYALRYALRIDERYHRDTMTAVLPDPNMALLYALKLVYPPRDRRPAEWSPGITSEQCVPPDMVGILRESTYRGSPTRAMWQMVIEPIIPEPELTIEDVRAVIDAPQLPDFSDDRYRTRELSSTVGDPSRLAARRIESGYCSNPFDNAHRMWQSPWIAALYLLFLRSDLRSQWTTYAIRDCADNVLKTQMTAITHDLGALLRYRTVRREEPISAEFVIGVSLSIPKMFEHLIEMLQLFGAEDGIPKLRAAISGKTRKMLIKSSSKNAIIVAKHIDGRPMADTLEGVAGNSKDLARYVRHFGVSPASFTPRLRAKIASLCEKPGAIEDLFCPSSWTVDADNNDTTPSRLTSAAGQACLEMSRSALALDMSKQTSENQATKKVEELLGHGRYHGSNFNGIHSQEERDLVRSLVRRGHTHLEWMLADDLGLWTYREPGSKCAPLKSSMSLADDSCPNFGYIGALGVVRGENVGVPSLEKSIREGLGVHGSVTHEMVLQWYRSLPGRVRSHVDRRLENTAREDPSLDKISVLWVGSTPIDSAVVYAGSRFQVRIRIDHTAALTIIPAPLGRRASGWAVIYPSIQTNGPQIPLTAIQRIMSTSAILKSSMETE